MIFWKRFHIRRNVNARSENLVHPLFRYRAYNRATDESLRSHLDETTKECALKKKVGKNVHQFLSVDNVST